jgi:hypothetical protein
MPRYPHLARYSKLRLLGAVATLVATAPFGGADAASRGVTTASGDIHPVACRSGAPVVQGPGIWQSFKAPTFAQPLGLTAGQDVVAYAVDPADPDRVAVTNGNSVYVSTDSGCRWSMGLRLDEVPSDPQNMPLSGEVTRIVALYISPAHRFYATAEELETGATVGRPHVIESSNGTTWTTGDSGLPPLGHPLTIKAARTNPNVMYLSFAGAREDSTCPPPPVPCPGGDSARPLGLLWGSTDGGKTWTSRTDPSDLNGSYPIKFISVEDDDASGSTIWVVANGELRVSKDGGRTYSSPDGLTAKDQAGFTFTAVESIDHGLDPGDRLRLVAFSAEGEMLRLEGAEWHRTHVPFTAVESVAQRAAGDIAVATTPQFTGQVSIWRIFPRDFKDFDEGTGLAGKRFKATWGWESITPGGNVLGIPARMTAASGGSAPDGAYYVRDQHRVLRFLGSAARGPIGQVIALPIGAPPPPLGAILPSVLDVNLPLGRSQTVDYDLTLPPAPTPIDVFLLIDNSGSMQPLIDDLKQSMGEVARALVKSGVDVNMGVGQINVQPDKTSPPIDDPRTPEDESKGKPLYQLLRRIGPVDSSFYQALGQIDGNGGSGDEAQLESLWQSVTGDGLSLLGIPALTGYSIPPHQEAGFRQGLDSIKVIIHATDEIFSTNIEGQGAHNSPGPVGDELRNNGVKQIGLSQGVDDARKSLADMARRTGALAPPGGTDCDGNGRADIPAGGALVCDQNYGLDKTIVNLLKSLSDHQTIALTTQPSQTMRNVTRTSFAIDAKQATHVKFQVTYSCVGVAPGSYDNTIQAALRGQSIAKAVATVNCGGPPGPLPHLGADPPPPPPVQPPPPVPVPVAPVNPITQAQTQIQSQVNPQAGVANQEQDQLQVATAENDITEPEVGDELAMSAIDPRSRWLAPGIVMAAGMAMSAGGAVALRRRTRTRVARATIR